MTVAVVSSLGAKVSIGQSLPKDYVGQLLDRWLSSGVSVWGLSWD